MISKMIQIASNSFPLNVKMYYTESLCLCTLSQEISHIKYVNIILKLKHSQPEQALKGYTFSGLKWSTCNGS